MHSLDLDIDDTNLNPRTFRVSDNSFYDDVLGVKNAILEITPPGCKFPIIFKVNKKFELIINSTLLHLNSAGLFPIPSLPDGIYTIKYSIAPNANVNVSFYYFRNTKQINEYFTLWTKLLESENKLRRKYFVELRDKLWEYKQYIDGAKYLVEDRFKLKEGMEVYNEISSALTKFSELC